MLMKSKSAFENQLRFKRPSAFLESRPLGKQLSTDKNQPIWIISGGKLSNDLLGVNVYRHYLVF